MSDCPHCGTDPHYVNDLETALLTTEDSLRSLRNGLEALARTGNTLTEMQTAMGGMVGSARQLATTTYQNLGQEVCDIVRSNRLERLAADYAADPPAPDDGPDDAPDDGTS